MLAFILGVVSFFSIGFNENREAPGIAPDTVKLPTKLQVKSDSGEYLEIQRIFIIGNKITRDRIILRELSLKSGDIVNSDELPLILERDQKKLFNTRLFNVVTVRPLELEPGKIDLLVDVNERWYTFPSLRLDLSDRNFNEWWQNYNHDFNRVNYGINLYQHNVRGRNETLTVRALFGFQHNFLIGYRIPYIDRKQKQGLSFNIEYQETKNLAYKTEDHKLKFIKSTDLLKITRGASVTYTYRNSFYETHSLTAEYHDSWINDTIRTLNENYFGNARKTQKYALLTYQFSSDHRDMVAYPLVGYQAIFSIQKIGLGLGDDVNKIEGNIVYSRFSDLKNGFYFSNFSNLSLSTPQTQPYANFSALGNRRQFVRGYEIYVIEAPDYILNKSTLKKRIFSRRYNWKLMPRAFEYIPISLYLKTYADLGYANNYPYYRNLNVNNTLTNKLLAGVGGGLDIVASYDLVIRLEYTFSAENRHGFFFNIKKEF